MFNKIYLIFSSGSIKVEYPTLASFFLLFILCSIEFYPFPVQEIPHWREKSSGVRQSKIYKCPEHSFGREGAIVSFVQSSVLVIGDELNSLRNYYTYSIQQELWCNAIHFQTCNRNSTDVHLNCTMSTLEKSVLSINHFFFKNMKVYNTFLMNNNLHLIRGISFPSLGFKL